jgi:glucose-1-phosphate thymidylyltransferase
MLPRLAHPESIFCAMADSASVYKGIVLAGGSGSRLYPITIGVSKQLLPVYDKPMIYYPLSVLMQAGIRDVLVIVNPEYQNQFRRLLGDGSRFGLNLSYAVQDEPRGLADAFRVGREFIGHSPVALVLGDNIFFGEGLTQKLEAAVSRRQGATIFAAKVKDPQAYGVIGFDAAGRVDSITEKPSQPASSYAVTGLYFYDNSVVDLARDLQPSPRGELEITDLNRLYLQQNALHVEVMGRGFAWLDTGTYDTLLAAQQFVATIEQRQGCKIGCLEEIAFQKGWLDLPGLKAAIARFSKTNYGDYLRELVHP